MQALVVDDDARSRHRLRSELEHFGYAVSEASDSGEAVARFDATPVHVVVTSIFMPQKYGLEAIRLIRRRDASVPIVALSTGPSSESPGAEEAKQGATAADVIEMAREFGATWVLGSPFDWDDFRDVLRELPPARRIGAGGL
jgi:CheY-like chemotaxis protein